MARFRLRYRLGLPITIVISLLIAISIVADVRLQEKQSEASLREQAYILSQQMQAVWDFVTANQDRINTDADGSYNFKGLHCSVAGTSVGALFTNRTDYIIRYVSDKPRNEKNTADELESEAIDSFRNDETLREYAAFDTTENEIEYYRYLIPLKMTSGCVSCHGKPAGEVDVTGFEKEGLSDGDLVGVASISIPTDTYHADLGERIFLRVLLSVAVLAACLLTIHCVTMRYVLRPLGKVESAVRKIGAGDLETYVDPDEINAKDEIRTLALRFNDMASELDSFSKDLEGKVSERTEQLAEANEMLAQQAKALEAANVQLQAEDRYKSHYFTMMSHELRTPLTAIRAYIDMLKDPALDDVAQKSVIQSIQANTISLSKLVNNILDSARLEVGAVKLEQHVVDASDIVNELAKTLEPLALAKEIRLHYHAAEDIPLFLADEDKLLHILENLGANAIKYSEEESAVRIAAYLHSENEGAVCFDVSDEGVGISEEDQQIVFQKFKQAESAIARPVSGSGLGLSLAKEYAELHGGTITVRSVPNEGSTFTVSIPYKKPIFNLDQEDVQ